MDAAPASVDQTLASPGRPLEPSLRQDMEQRFGHDFSRVRVHIDSRAAGRRKVYRRLTRSDRTVSLAPASLHRPRIVVANFWRTN